VVCLESVYRRGEEAEHSGGFFLFTVHLFIYFREGGVGQREKERENLKQAARPADARLYLMTLRS